MEQQKNGTERNLEKGQGFLMFTQSFLHAYTTSMPRGRPLEKDGGCVVGIISSKPSGVLLPSILRAVLAGEHTFDHLIFLDHSQQPMFSQVQHKSNLRQRRIGMNLLKYKEEQEIVIREKRISPVQGIAARGRPPETRLSSRVAVAAQPINKRIVDRS